MSYELYGFSGACSTAVHVVLNEIGQDAEYHQLVSKNGDHKKPEFLKINPRGQIPVLIEDGKALREGAAQIIYLCEKHNSPLLPKSGWERAQALQWLMFGNASLHPAYNRTSWINKNLPEEQRPEALKTARAQIQEMWDFVEAELEKSAPYLCGKDVTAGDILVTVIGNWSPENYKFGPKTKALFKNVSSRPAYQKAMAAEQAEYKAAA
jgi:glutathione S-transferase